MDCHLRYVHLCFVQMNFEELYIVHFNTTVGHVITLGWSLRNHFHSHTCMNHRILECIRTQFIIAFQNACAKTKNFDETHKNRNGVCCGTFPFAACSSRLIIPAVSANQNWKRVCLRFLSENRNRKLRSESSFLFPHLSIVQFDVVRQHLDLRHKQHTNACRQHVLNLHVLVSLVVRFFGSILTLGISASKGSSSSSFPISASARDSPNWFDVITDWCHISIQSFRWTYESTALPSPFPDC